MKILAIETSCDETAIALLDCTLSLPRPEIKVLANSLMSQVEIHAQYGGVYPMLAKREHIKNLPILLENTLKEAGESLEAPDIEYIAVTAGPGLEPALWTGITFTEELGKKWGKPVIPVNHMAGHLFSFLYKKQKALEFSAIALLVSGGHTELVLVEGFDNYKIIGKTRDDAVGEAFDKTARLLGFPYPGGPKISELAEAARKREQAIAFRFPSPMLNTNDYNFSYSGLKTAVLYTLKKLGEVDMQTKEDIALAFEEAAIRPLVEKARRAAEEHGAKSLILGGGVSANKYLQREIIKMSEELALDLHLPESELFTDNAIMIGIAAYVQLLTNRIPKDKTIIAKGNLAL